MSSNRIHLLEFSHMDLTVSACLSLWLRNLSGSNTTTSFSFSTLFLLSLCRKLGLDAERFFA
jgi:hypothetical protein